MARGQPEDHKINPGRIRYIDTRISSYVYLESDTILEDRSRFLIDTGGRGNINKNNVVRRRNINI